MTSSNETIFRVTGHLRVNFPHKGQWRGALMSSLICAWINGWVNNGEAVDFRRQLAHYNVTVMSQAHERSHVLYICTVACTCEYNVAKSISVDHMYASWIIIIICLLWISLSMWWFHASVPNVYRIQISVPVEFSDWLQASRSHFKFNHSSISLVSQRAMHWLLN